jgi:GTP-sensing pleiotropic transcriptional regulator CodY
MILILRQFLKEMNIPNIIFQETFAIEMKKLLSYDEATDNYKDVTSNYIPIVSSFCSFWDEHMIEDYTASDLEIEDVIDMFFKHTSHKFTNSLTSELVVDILKHHICSDVIIEQNKYIHNIRYNFPSKPTT